MAVEAGLAQVAIMQAGTLDAIPTGVIVLGITQNENLQTSRFRGIRVDHSDYEIPNYENLMVSAATLQGNLYMFDTLIGYRHGNCDIQIITGEGKVFKFKASSNPLGIEPKLIYNKDSRIIQVDLEGAFPSSQWDLILQTASSDTAVDLGYDPISGKDFGALRLPNSVTVECPVSTQLSGKFIEHSITIEPKRKEKTIDNISLFDKMTATISLQIENVSLTDYRNQRAKGISPSIKYTVNNTGSAYDAFNFNANVLVHYPNLEINGDNVRMNVEYKGSFNISNMSLATGVGNGGSAADGGISGGTYTISA